MVAALKVKLLPSQQPMNLQRTTNAEAYEQVLIGKEARKHGGYESYQRAVVAFQRALDLDPNYANAYAGLGQAQAFYADFSATPAERAAEIKKAFANADKAIALAPDLAAAYWVRGLLRHRLDPSFQDFARRLGCLLGTCGEQEERSEITGVKKLCFPKYSENNLISESRRALALSCLVTQLSLTLLAFVALPGSLFAGTTTENLRDRSMVPQGLSAKDWSDIRRLRQPQESSITQQAYLKASNTEAQDNFGVSVAISGDTAVVGAPDESSSSTGVNGDQNNNNAPHSGAAYVFARSNGSWTQQAYLKASNTAASDLFGRAVAISGNTIVIGAPTKGAGAAYVFVRKSGTWTQQANLKASNADSGDLFGISVAIARDTVIIGASSEASAANGVNGDQLDNNARDAGAAYVFARNGGSWTQQAYLKASNSGGRDGFATAVAIAGDIAVVGAPKETAPQPESTATREITALTLRGLPMFSSAAKVTGRSRLT